MSVSGSVDITTLAVNDDPVLDPASSLDATVNAGNKVQLTLDMLNVLDVDSADKNIVFRVLDSTTGTDLDKGRLVFENFENSGENVAIAATGGVFTLDDVKSGRVYYYQTGSAGENETDNFSFQILDNAQSLHWDAQETRSRGPAASMIIRLPFRATSSRHSVSRSI